MTIDVSALPIAADVREWHQLRGGDVLRTALSGGDDYELLFTVRQAHRGRLRGALNALSDLRVTRIGVVTKERALCLREEERTRELPGGYEHFRALQPVAAGPEADERE
jgi:thiamine-monophosphate kinase